MSFRAPVSNVWESLKSTFGHCIYDLLLIIFDSASRDSFCLFQIKVSATSAGWRFMSAEVASDESWLPKWSFDSYYEPLVAALAAAWIWWCNSNCPDRSARLLSISIAFNILRSWSVSSTWWPSSLISAASPGNYACDRLPIVPYCDLVCYLLL